MRRRLAQVALAAGTMVLCLVVIDRIVFWTFPLGRIVYRPDPVQLYGYTPGTSKYFIHSQENGGDWVRVDINDRGYRGDALGSPDGAVRLLVYGDSYVAAEYSPLEQTYPKRLGAELQAITGRAVEAINAGLVGAGPDQVAKRMPAELEALEPDGVVLVITSANDFGDLVRNKLYRIGPDGRLLERTPELGPGLRRMIEPGWLSHSGLGRLLRAAWRGAPLRWREFGLGSQPPGPPPRPLAKTLIARQQLEYGNSLIDEDPVVRNLFDDLYDADVSLLPESDSARAKRALMAGVLGETERIAREAGVPLLVVAVPSPIDVTPDHFGLRADWSRFPGYQREALTRAVTEPARELGLPVLDLFGPMHRSPDPDALFFRPGNDHWNARGQAMAARLTAERIAGLGWFDPGGTANH